MSNELKPCAHCGGAAVIKRRKTVMVSCTQCTAATFQSLDGKESAIADWNRRTTSGAASGEVRECNACDWKGVTDRMCGGIGPLCPECGETTEAAPVEQSAPPVPPMDQSSCIPPSRAEPASQHDADARDAARYRWLCNNNFDRERSTQIHTWVHEWHPHSVTNEPIKWKQRVRGGALDHVIDEMMKVDSL